MGLMFGLIYAAYGLAFWYGCKLVMDYRKKEEYMQCILDCVVHEDGFDCFLNCDRLVVIRSILVCWVCRTSMINVEIFSGSQWAPLQQPSSGSSTVGCRLDSLPCMLRLWPRLKLLLFKSSMSLIGRSL